MHDVGLQYIQHIAMDDKQRTLSLSNGLDLKDILAQYAIDTDNKQDVIYPVYWEIINYTKLDQMSSFVKALKRGGK